MKKSLRFASAALAVMLAAQLASPAFAAAQSSLKKEETVYVVLNADGSAKSVTVSEHLSSDDGLAGVTDKSTLSNIENTESDATYTRNGEALVWDTDDTDLYYKGDTDRALPVSATVTYILDGQTAPLEELLGKSGHLTVQIDLENHETGTVEVNGENRTIVTPLVAAVGVILGQDAKNVTAEHGLLESAAKSTVAAFVTLPGVKSALDGLLPDSVSSFEDYLRDSVTVEADVENLTAPSIVIACAASAEDLGENLGKNNAGLSLDSLNDLTDGLEELNDAMSQLLDGASQLVDGAVQLSDGSLALLDGASQLNSGAATLRDGMTSLDSGLGQLTDGLDTLTANNDALNSAAQQVADGVLASANDTLIEGGLIDTPMTWDNYAAVIDEVLTLGDKTLAAGRKKMVRTIWEQEPSFKDSQLDLALYLAATQTNHDLEAALRLMQNFDSSMLTGAIRLATDTDAQQTAHEELVYQVANSQDIADVGALKDSLASIQLFVSSVNQYTGGVASAANGAHSAKDGSKQLADGANSLANGAKSLYDGVNSLNSGVGQLADGTAQLNSGLNQFNDEGISQLTGSLDTDQIHALKLVLDEMSARLEDYDNFAGAPDDADSKVIFLYKTGETVAAQAETETEVVTEEGNFFSHLWQRIVNLFQF